jgi:hypothetical protein
MKRKRRQGKKITPFYRTFDKDEEFANMLLEDFCIWSDYLHGYIIRNILINFYVKACWEEVCHGT